MKNYDQYLDYKRPKLKHSPMSMENRAAQFLPFSALSGYEELIEKSSQVKKDKPLLSDDRMAQINAVLQTILFFPSKPLLEIYYFDEDSSDYTIVVERFKTFHRDKNEIILEHQQTIHLDNIVDIVIL